MPAATDHRAAIATTLKRFGILPLGNAATTLLKTLGYVSAANRFRRSLHRSGHLSASDARVEAQRHIRDTEWSQALGRALAARFHEVIVDEAQDCNPADIEILAWLRNHRLRVTVVCDPDQAIYEFRDGSPDGLRAFAEQYRNEDRLRLTGNFRSSSPICALAATLRSRQDPDKPLGEAATSAHPVIVAAYSGGTVPAEIGHVFITCLQAEAGGLKPADGVVLAHRHRDAHRAAGDCLRSEMSGTSRIETLARALSEFWSPSATGRSIESAVLKVERLVLELMGHWQEDDHHPSRVAERVEIDRRQLRRQALQLLMKLPTECEDSEDERTAWMGSVQAEVESLGLALPRKTTVRRFFARPRGSKWARHLQPPELTSLPCSTIHEAKGKEFEAVCVVFRPDRAPENQTSELFDSWENRTDLEAKRVIYVGVTRASRLVMLAVPAAFVDRCSAILERWQVRHEFVAADGRITHSSR
jgi:DNA helicase II / ATP-dependent DNA helicase PcrA